jgi:hypothetical protein
MNSARVMYIAATILSLLVPLCRANTTVSVVVRGPWAYAIVGSGTNAHLVLIAPKDDEGHYPPSVMSLKEDLELSSSAQNVLTFVAQVQPLSPKCDSITDNGYPAPMKAADFNSLYTSPNNYYVVVLPVPDSCAPSQEFKSDISTTFNAPHPNPTLYPAGMMFTYTVSAAGFNMNNSTKPYDFEGGNEIDIWMQPNGGESSFCDMDSRHAFHSLVTTLKLTLFEDFNEKSGYRDHTCLAIDEQNPHPGVGGSTVRHLTRLLKHFQCFLDRPSLGGAMLLKADFKAFKTAAIDSKFFDHARPPDSLQSLEHSVDYWLGHRRFVEGREDLRSKLKSLITVYLDGAGSCRAGMIRVNPT